MINCKTCAKRPLSKRSKMFFKANHRLMQVKGIAEIAHSALSGRFTQVLLYSLIIGWSLIIEVQHFCGR